jgi:hypothetical protein
LSKVTVEKVINVDLVAFGGLGVSVLLIGPKVADSNAAEDDGFLLAIKSVA